MAITFSQFIEQPLHWRIMADVLGIGIFGGIFIVPLYALIQERSSDENRSRVIAGNNIINALFMVIAAITAMVCLKYGWTIPDLFLLCGDFDCSGFDLYLYSGARICLTFGCLEHRPFNVSPKEN